MKVEGPKWLVERVICFARALDVYGFDLKITRKQKSSECSRKPDGSFVINIQKDLTKKHWAYTATEHLAHEMVHLRQYKHDTLVGDCDENVTYWKGEPYLPVRYMSDEYFLSPWEMEARALEDWLVHKWETRKSELH